MSLAVRRIKNGVNSITGNTSNVLQEYGVTIAAALGASMVADYINNNIVRRYYTGGSATMLSELTQAVKIGTVVMVAGKLV